VSSCSEASLELREPLGGTGMVAERWVCAESREPWGRDPVADGELPAFGAEGKVLAIRRPGRERIRGLAFTAVSAEGGGELRVHEPVGAELGPGTLLDRTLFLVCAHGRRDPCCSRLGIPIFKALEFGAGDAEVPLVWQCSHTGGHRFAPNVVVLPWGVTLGRVPLHGVAEVRSALLEGRVPLELYRGRSIYPAEVQAVEVDIRLAGGFDRLDELRLVSHVGDHVVFETPTGETARRVSSRPGPTLPKSCGAEPEQVSVFDVEEV
jgi:hypothetical protein